MIVVRNAVPAHAARPKIRAIHSSDWFFEVKWDGFRARARRERPVQAGFAER
jgi:ATP-dependent DNA ligase